MLIKKKEIKKRKIGSGGARVGSGRKLKSREETTNLRISKLTSRKLSQKAKRKGITKLELLDRYADSKYF
jgi:hypothetical protein